MAETFRRTKLERFIKMLEDELPELEDDLKENSGTSMALYYEGIYKTKKGIINKLRREFKLKEEQK